jgi:hypothetical protein
MSKQSNKAFLKGIENGQFNTDKARIYHMISIEPQTLESLEIKLGKKGKNTFSGRITELLDSGLIKEIIFDSKKYTKYAIVIDAQEQIGRSVVREFNKANNWLNQGKEKGYINLLGLTIR